MLPWPHLDHLGFRRVEAILSEYVGQNHPIAQRRFPFSFNVEDQYSQGQTSPARKTQGGRQMGQASRTPPETEKPNIQPRIDDASQGYSSTKPAIDLLGFDEPGERKPPISSGLPLLPQLLRNDPTPLNAPSHQAAAPPPRPNTGVEIHVEVYPPGRGSNVRVAPGKQFSVPGLGEANDSGHGQLGSNIGAPGPKSLDGVGSRGRSSQVLPGPEKASSRAEHQMASGGRRSQVPPGPKKAEISLDARIPPNPPSDTATRTIDLDEAKDSRHTRFGSNPGASGAGTPLSLGSRGRSSQVIPASRGRSVASHSGGSGGETPSSTSNIE